MAFCAIDGNLVEIRRAWKVAIRRPNPAAGGTKATVDYDHAHYFSIFSLLDFRSFKPAVPSHFLKGLCRNRPSAV